MSEPKVDRSRGTVKPPRVIRRGLTWYVVAEGEDVSSHRMPEEAAEALRAYNLAADLEHGRAGLANNLGPRAE